jgi:hypothetical protein
MSLTVVIVVTHFALRSLITSKGSGHKNCVFGPLL